MPPKGWKKERDPNEVKPPRTNRIQNASMYLGKDDERAKRLAALDRLAKKFKAENRSVLIQMIADGDIKLTPS